MRAKTTIQDIAKRAGVGAGTVSRVLNNRPHVSPGARVRVEQAIAEFDYRPSFAARHLRTQKSQVIAFISDEIATTPFAGRTIEGAQSFAWAHNRLLFVVNTRGDPEMEKAVIDTMLARQVEGIIYAAMYHKQVEPPSALREVPTVLLDCYCDKYRDNHRDNHCDNHHNDSVGPVLPSVVPDEQRAGFEATDLLIRRGHRRVALINPRATATATTLRVAGYREALAAHDLPFDEALVRYGNWAADGGYTHTHAVMTLAEPPTALFCANDRTAMGAYDALRELHLRVPEDVAVIGFDNQEVIAAFLRPALSTMSLPHFEMGRWAVRHLLESHDTPPAPVQHKIACPFVARASI